MRDLKGELAIYLRGLYANVRAIAQGAITDTFGPSWRGNKWIGESIWIDNTTIQVNSSHQLYVAAGGGTSLTSSNATLSTDVSLPNNSWTDILSLSLVSGTWLVLGVAQVAGPSGSNVFASKIYAGSTIYSANENQINWFQMSLRTVAIITLTSTTTVKLAVIASTSGMTAKVTTPDFTSANVATQLNAVKIA